MCGTAMNQSVSETEVLFYNKWLFFFWCVFEYQSTDDIGLSGIDGMYPCESKAEAIDIV